MNIKSFLEKLGIPKKSLCYVTNWEFTLESIKYNCLVLCSIWGLLNTFVKYHTLMIFSLVHRVYNVTI